MYFKEKERGYDSSWEPKDQENQDNSIKVAKMAGLRRNQRSLEKGNEVQRLETFRVGEYASQKDSVTGTGKSKRPLGPASALKC